MQNHLRRLSDAWFQGEMKVRIGLLLDQKILGRPAAEDESSQQQQTGQ